MSLFLTAPFFPFTITVTSKQHGKIKSAVIQISYIDCMVEVNLLWTGSMQDTGNGHTISMILVVQKPFSMSSYYEYSTRQSKNSEKTEKYASSSLYTIWRKGTVLLLLHMSSPLSLSHLFQFVMLYFSLKRARSWRAAPI